VRVSGVERRHHLVVVAARRAVAQELHPSELVLTAPPRSEGWEKLQLPAVLGRERFSPAAPGAG